MDVNAAVSKVCSSLLATLNSVDTWPTKEVNNLQRWLAVQRSRRSEQLWRLQHGASAPFSSLRHGDHRISLPPTAVLWAWYVQSCRLAWSSDASM